MATRRYRLNTLVTSRVTTNLVAMNLSYLFNSSFGRKGEKERKWNVFTPMLYSEKKKLKENGIYFLEHCNIAIKTVPTERFVCC